MMKTDASAAQNFWYWKKPFCYIFPLRKNSLKFFLISKYILSLPPSLTENTYFPTLFGGTEREHWLDMG